MIDRLTVTIDGPELREVPAEFHPSGSFEVRVDNVGRATHVHLGLTGGFEPTEGNPDANHFVDSDGSLDLTVDVPRMPAEGELTVATGHGAEEARVPIRASRDRSEPSSLSAEESADDDRAIEREWIGVAAVALVGVILAGVALTMTGNIVVGGGVAVVVAAVVFGAIYLAAV